MTRPTKEWSGKAAEAVPPRIRLRVFDRDKGRCQSCQRKIGPADKWQTDHKVALINGGLNHEANLQTLCSWCHKEKTAEDVREKAYVKRVRYRTLGLDRDPKIRTGRRFNGTPIKWNPETRRWEDYERPALEQEGK